MLKYTRQTRCNSMLVCFTLTISLFLGELPHKGTVANDATMATFKVMILCMTLMLIHSTSPINAIHSYATNPVNFRLNTLICYGIGHWGHSRDMKSSCNVSYYHSIFSGIGHGYSSYRYSQIQSLSVTI